MPVLLLCQGDDDAKTMLRRAIEARYGINPPALESLHLTFKGGMSFKLGPVTTRVPLTVQARFRFPTYLRWDFVVKPMKLPVQRGIEAFDGQVYRSTRGSNQTPDEVTSPDVISSVRSRLWAMASILLTPLSDHYIKITHCGDSCLQAENTKLNDTVKLHFSEDGTMDYAEVYCLNPDTEQYQTMTLRMEDGQMPVDGLMLPKKISAYWDDDFAYEMQPETARMNPTIDTGLFTLEHELA
jgi:hypothetical protein